MIKDIEEKKMKVVSVSVSKNEYKLENGDVFSIPFELDNEQIGRRLFEFTLVNNPTMDDRLSNKVLKSNGWMKQENKTKIHSFS